MNKGQIVLVDTCVIIEAFRTNCWGAVTSYFSVETVEKCAEEARSGDPLRRNYVKVDPKALQSGLKAIHPVNNAQRAALAMQLPTAYALDDGERDLLAHAFARTDVVLIVSADKAAVYATLELGWRDRIISLEAAASANGGRPELREQYGEKWLGGTCSDWVLKKI